MSGSSPLLLLLLFVVVAAIEAAGLEDSDWDAPLLIGLLSGAVVAGVAGAALCVAEAVAGDRRRRGQAIRWALLGGLVPVGMLILIVAYRLSEPITFM